jgi:hypothetical protein
MSSMMNGTLPSLLPWLLAVLLARDAFGSDSTAFTEEKFYSYQDEMKKKRQSGGPGAVSKRSFDLASGLSTGASYAPMLWMKKSYYDAYAVPLGIFEGYSPWHFRAGLDFRMGKSGGRMQWRFPLSVALSGTSSSAPLRFYREGDEFTPTEEARISRSHTIVLAEAAAALSVAGFSAGRVTISFVPEIGFIAGFSRLKVEKPFTVDYYDSLANVIISFYAPILPVDYAFGIKTGAAVECLYSMTNRLSVFVSADVARMWSTVLRNSKRGEWVAGGLDGYKREVRFNSMIFGMNTGVVIAISK